ncbi:hypothetical protein MBLNU230_g1711t1 [Neophaeotheca triangularis]
MADDDDTVSCFKQLLENIPGWITELESILEGVTQRQNDYLLAYQGDEPPKFASRKPSKSSSVKSAHSSDDAKQGTPEVPDPTKSQAALLEPQLQHLTSSDVLRLAQRKRKTASVCSAGQSAPSKFRSRSMVVVYYDGGVQKQFETLVRGIGTCRNALRKGKMNARLNAISRRGSSSSESSETTDCEHDEQFGREKLPYKSTRQSETPGGMFSSQEAVKPFDRVDDTLEKSQALCERAAHQVLRDGDCAFEIKGAKAQLVEAERATNEELPAIEEKAAKEAGRRRRSEERHRQEEARKAKERDAKKSSGGQVNNAVVTTFANVPNDGHLEIDDDDDSDDGDGEFNIETLKMGRFHGLRSTRLTAH